MRLLNLIAQNRKQGVFRYELQKNGVARLSGGMHVLCIRPGKTLGKREGDRGDLNPRPSEPQSDALTS